MKIRHSGNLILILILCLCHHATVAQTEVLYKAKKIYIADTAFSSAEAMVVDGGKILATGTYSSLKYAYPHAKVVNYGRQFIYPGFIDAHCHFLNYAKSLKECDLKGTRSAADVVGRLKKYNKTNQHSWIIGRGWDQNDWADKEFPDMTLLDDAFPDKPVYLRRIDGHAVWINSAAVKALHLNTDTTIEGGEIVFKNGKFTGILIDNAIDFIWPRVPPMPEDMKIAAVGQAAMNCYATGLTTLDEAGLDIGDIRFLQNLQETGRLDMKFYAMLSANEANLGWIAEHGIEKTDRMHVRSVKFYMDGSLGSRGALLKQDYCDRMGHRGLTLTKPDQFFSYSYFLFTKGFQVCTHAIGDSAQKIVLNTYRKILPEGYDLRWRVEHAQVTDPADFNLYKNRSIIPSVQPTHATSDAPWAEKRLCEHRMAGAYAYETLRLHAGMLALGTDFPIEDISPLKTFYSAVTRLDAEGNLKEPFIPRQSLSRKHALWGMTLWAAISNFEESEKGSLEAGKVADFVVLKKDLMEVKDSAIPDIKVKATYINGKKVFGK